MTTAGASAVTRTSIEVEGLGHGGLPIPAASRVGPVIATGGVRGVDPETGTVPPDLRDQLRLMFDNLVHVVEAAGGNAQTILKVTVRAADRSVREPLNEVWVRHFPDPRSRPARHLEMADLPGGMQVQCEALALAADESEEHDGE